MRINREIIRLSVPAILSNITVPLLGLCDTAIAGHLGADSFIGAIAVGSMMINVTFWLFGFLRMGTTGLTAQAFGADDAVALRTVFSRAVTLGAAIGTLLLLLMYPLREMLLTLISPDEPIRSLASRYYTIVLMSAPALLATNAVQGWLFGMQTTLIPMTVAIATNVINIAISLTMVLIFHTGFIGVAIGTLSANWLGLLLALILARRKAGGKLWIPFRDVFTDREGLGRFFRVNSDIFFRSAAIMAVSLGVTAIGSRLGALTLAANAVMMQFFNFFSFFMDGLAFTAEALTGRFAGARDFGMLRRSRNALLWWSAAIAALFFGIYCFAPDPIVALITDSPTVRADIRNYYLRRILHRTDRHPHNARGNRSLRTAVLRNMLHPHRRDRTSRQRQTMDSIPRLPCRTGNNPRRPLSTGILTLTHHDLSQNRITRQIINEYQGNIF